MIANPPLSLSSPGKNVRLRSLRTGSLLHGGSRYKKYFGSIHTSLTPTRS
jgi:hypothetical protein